MPGTKGKKLIPRKSKTGKFFSVKSLVFHLLTTQPTITKDGVEKAVMKEYPLSNFASKDGKGGHFAWYKHRFMKEKLEDEFIRLKEKNGNEKATEPEKQEKPVETKPKVDGGSASSPIAGDKGRADAVVNSRRKLRP